jgi:hypothetical protein
MYGEENEESTLYFSLAASFLLVLLPLKAGIAVVIVMGRDGDSKVC